MIRPPLRLALYLLYLTLVVAIGGALLYRLRSFEGLIVIERGKSEHWVVRPAEEGGIFSFAQRSLPAELIQFDNPRAAVRMLGDSESFNALPLPFSLHLNKAEVLESPPKKDVLEVLHSGEHQFLDVHPGLTVDVPEGRVTVNSVEPWAGLVRDGRGTPMAAVALRSNDDPWPPPVFVRTDTNTHPRPGVMIQLRVHPNEAAAREAATAQEAPVRELRWGVREAGRIHWFDGLAPGTGVTTADGTEYTLVESAASESGGPAQIRVEKKTADGAALIDVTANQNSPDDDILFERHDNKIVFLLHAWRDGAVLAVPWVDGKRQPERPLNEGETLEVKQADDSALGLRLDQAAMKAIPVPDMPDGVKALVLNVPDGVMRLREGMSRALKETRFIYRRQQQPPAVRYTITGDFGKDTPGDEFILKPGDRKRVDGWHFFHDQDNVGAATVAVLRVRRVPATPGEVVAVLLFIAGAAGLLIVRFGIIRPLPPVPTEPEDMRTWTPVDETPPSDGPKEEDALSPPGPDSFPDKQDSAEG